MLKNMYLNIKDVLLWILFFILIIGFIFSQVKMEKHINISIDKVGKELSEHVEGEIKQENSLTFKKRYSLSPEEYKGIVYYGPVSNMNVEEVLLVEMKDSSQEYDLMKAMEKRIEYQVTNFDGYGTDQLELLDKAKIIFNGSYGVLIIAKNINNVENLYNKLIKEGEKNGI